MAVAFRTLLRNIQTGLWYDGHGGWTSKPAQAHDYKSSLSAIKAAHTIQTDNLYLVLKFSDDRLDVSHPISSFKSTPPQSPGTKVPSIIISLLPFAVEAAKHLKTRLN